MSCELFHEAAQLPNVVVCHIFTELNGMAAILLGESFDRELKNALRFNDFMDLTNTCSTTLTMFTGKNQHNNKSSRVYTEEKKTHDIFSVSLRSRQLSPIDNDVIYIDFDATSNLDNRFRKATHLVGNKQALHTMHLYIRQKE